MFHGVSRQWEPATIDLNRADLFGSSKRLQGCRPIHLIVSRYFGFSPCGFCITLPVGLSVGFVHSSSNAALMPPRVSFTSAPLACWLALAACRARFASKI